MEQILQELELFTWSVICYLLNVCVCYPVSQPSSRDVDYPLWELRICVCIYICICMCICVYICMCICVYVYIYIYILYYQEMIFLIDFELYKNDRKDFFRSIVIEHPGFAEIKEIKRKFIFLMSQENSNVTNRFAFYTNGFLQDRICHQKPIEVIYLFGFFLTFH